MATNMRMTIHEINAMSAAAYLFSGSGIISLLNQKRHIEIETKIIENMAVMKIIVCFIIDPRWVSPNGSTIRPLAYGGVVAGQPRFRFCGLSFLAWSCSQVEKMPRDTKSK
jgi:hypothetical protein